MHGFQKMHDNKLTFNGVFDDFFFYMSTYNRACKTNRFSD